MKLANSLAVALLIGTTTLTGLPERIVGSQLGIAHAQAADATGLDLNQKSILLLKKKVNLVVEMHFDASSLAI